MNSSRTGLQRLAVALLSLAPLSAPLFAQTTATTTPVGFITVTVPAAASATKPGGKALSVPLYNAAAFAAAVASVDSATSFTLSGATWAANQFTGAPHFVRIKSGAQVGRSFLITSHTANQLTVDTQGGTLVGVVGVNDSCEIVPANTLGSLFGTTTPIVHTGASADIADYVLLWNGTDWEKFFHNGTHWRNTLTADSQNGTVVYPDEGLVFVRQKAEPLTLTLMGTVPSTTERTELIPAGSTFAAHRFPVDTQLVNLGLHQLPGWKSGSSANQADTVLVWTGSTWSTFYYDGTNWRRAGNLKVQDTTVIAAGTSVLITRSSTSPAVLTQNLPYAP